MSDSNAEKVKIGDLFTQMELRQAVEIYEETGSVQALKEKVVMPALDRINRVTGYDNDAMLLAYNLECAALTVYKRRIKQ